MNERVIKRYYFVAGILFAIAVLAGIIRLFDILLEFDKLAFLNIVAIIFLGLSLLTLVTLILHSFIFEKQKIKEELRRKDEPEKLKKYASRKKKKK